MLKVLSQRDLIIDKACFNELRKTLSNHVVPEICELVKVEDIDILEKCVDNGDFAAIDLLLEVI